MTTAVHDFSLEAVSHVATTTCLGDLVIALNVLGKNPENERRLSVGHLLRMTQFPQLMCDVNSLNWIRCSQLIEVLDILH